MFKAFLEYLERKRKQKEYELLQEERREARMRLYNDVAFLLWYKVAYDDVLVHKRLKMEDQREPFMIYQWGEKNLIFGPIKALTTNEDKEKFMKTAQAELRDWGMKCKVRVYPDRIVVSAA